ncbi:serine/threonine protein kinase [Mycolicibacterium smegmatis]|uniref:serine/threonine protein kinase n=1 Tax=Mycolicibacterium smegmatis TaxID=1772 RepID=UPI001303C36D|nr:serine/threonine-protein kinase [Mycolicibacterium smegmatis]
MPLANGEIFAGFSIIRSLGSGGMGEVYLAKHPRLPRHEALKILPTEVSADPDFRARFNREADLAATLYHPHIVGVHDRGEYEGRLWISMDYVEGSDAARLLRQKYPSGMPVDEALEIVTAIASALDYAHDRELLHRDVKPANILLTTPAKGTRRILLADFGIARSTNDISGLTATNMAVGSVNYASPEQLLGEFRIDGRADQYSLAATAYHLLTGVPVFEHSNPAVVISQHLNSAPRPVSKLRPELSNLDKVVATALAKVPDERYPSCQDFAGALSKRRTSISRQSTTVAALPKATKQVPKVRSTTPQTPEVRATIPPPPPPVREAPSTTSVAVSIALIVLILVGFGFVWWKVTGPEGRSSNLPSRMSTATTSRPDPPAAIAPPLTAPDSEVTSAAPKSLGPVEGSDCPHADLNVVTTSSTGASVRCTSGPGGYTWQPDSGTEVPDPAIVGQIGWDNCIKQFPRPKCVAAAAAMVGAPKTDGPVFPPGTYEVPNTMAFGTYAALPQPGGFCAYYIYDKAGKLHDSGTYNNAMDKPIVEVNPFADGGRFQTVGCTPWAMIKPLDPDW